MSYRGSKIILFVLTTAFLGCGDKSRPSVDRVNRPAKDDKILIKPSRSDSLEDSTLNQGVTSSEQINQEAKSNTLFFQKKEQQIVPYELPPALQKKIEEEQEAPQPKVERHFELINPFLRIDVEAKNMTLQAILRVQGVKDENIHLRCDFDPSSITWDCDDMFPVDVKIAKQRRMQATVNCLDNYRCQEIGLDFFVKVNGKTETQHFESHPVRVRLATSGDANESDESAHGIGEPIEPEPKATAPKKKLYTDTIPQEESNEEQTTPPRKLVQQEPELSEPEPEKSGDQIPGEEQPVTQEPEVKSEPQVAAEIEVEEEEPDLTPEELDQALSSKEDVALEYNAPIEMPKPSTNSDYSVEGTEKLKPTKMGKGARNQAIRRHNSGQLQAAEVLPRKGAKGYIIRTAWDRKGIPIHSYGTDIMLELIQSTFKKMQLEKRFENRPPVVIADISQQHGGKLYTLGKKKDGTRKSHASHQTGLDADISFPSKSTKFNNIWPAVGKGSISSQFDVERFLFIAETLACAEGNPLMVIFIDERLERKTCAFAKSIGKNVRDKNSCAYKALSRMRHANGHYNHFHMRLNCPGNTGCLERKLVPQPPKCD